MKITLLLAAIILAGVPSTAQSYEHLEGRRLAQFLKTGGRCEAGRLVTVHLPAKVLAGAEIVEGPVRRRRSFAWKKLRVEVDRNNCYWRQTLRKLKKDAKGTVIMKGRVRWRREEGKGRDHFLLLDTIQKTSRRH